MSSRLKTRSEYTNQEILSAIHLLLNSLNDNRDCECGEKGYCFAVFTQLNPEGLEGLNAVIVCKTCLEDLKSISSLLTIIDVRKIKTRLKHVFS